jgi:hypothetical protein
MHIIADFYLQPHAWIMSKVKYKEKSIGLLKHMGVHTLLTSFALAIATFYVGHDLSYDLFIALVIIILTHYVIDIWKTYMGFTTPYFVMDQLGHIIILAGVSFWLSGADITSFHTWLIANFKLHYLYWLIAYALAFKPLSILIQLILRPYTEQISKDSSQGLQTAGEHIGALERILVITFVLMGQYAGIGFLLAAKSVFRFGDMRREQDRKLTEYIMLGTLLSFTFALLLGLLVKATYR